MNENPTTLADILYAFDHNLTLLNILVEYLQELSQGMEGDEANEIRVIIEMIDKVRLDLLKSVG